jgi:exodeoxyribonuclease VII small subunit
MVKEEAELPVEPQPVTSFETDLDELETIVNEMEKGEETLERSLELFERGMQLSETCRKILLEAETKVETIVKRQSQYETEPFGPAK